MSWTESFPVLNDEMVEAYEAEVGAEERAEFDDWFAVDRVIYRSKARHLVVFSLFWRNLNTSDPDLPTITRETLLKAEEKGLVERFAPWNHYVQPLLDGAEKLRETRPEIGVRIYLAADLHFLVEDFTALGCEVCLMKTSSLRHNPGAMWRFLALEEKTKLITISDADRARLLEADIQRTELMSKIGLGFWRVPVWGELNDKGMINYRPIVACQLGSAKALPSRLLMKALIWHTRHGTISNKCRLPGCGEQTIYGTAWPDYGFDEWFLQAAIYPRVARQGILSFIPAAARSQLLPLDIEYCTWANPRSEINYFGTDGKCCGGAANLGEDATLKPLIESKRWVMQQTSGLTQQHQLPPQARRARPDDTDITGKVLGWMNPSICVWKRQRWLAYRTECHPVFHWSRVSLARLDKVGNVIAGSNAIIHCLRSSENGERKIRGFSSTKVECSSATPTVGRWVWQSWMGWAAS